MIFKYIFLFSFLIVSSAQASCGPFNPLWKKCKSDKDCLVMLNACSVKSAYNRSFLKEISKYNECLKPIIECSQNKSADSENEAFCLKEVCELKPLNN